MPLSLLFWILMLLWLVLGLYRDYAPAPAPFIRGGWSVLAFVLLGILGWHVFGAAIR